jgi:hypothetical protein
MSLAVQTEMAEAKRDRGGIARESATPKLSRQAHENKSRDGRLDFWRGLCLIDMVIVHMVYEGVRMGAWLTPVFAEYLRFAAGGFIFLAGLGVSYIYLQKARDDAKRPGVYRSLWRRSLYLLAVHYAASLSFILIYPLRGYEGFYPSPWRYALDVLMLRQGSDLLLFYVMMVALSPAMLELMRRGYGWLLALLSIGLFALGQWHPQLLALPIQQGFQPVLWQLVFIAGICAGAGLKRYDAFALRGKLAVAGGALAVMATVWLMAYGPLALWAWNAGIDFHKNPLSTGEAARYLSLIVVIMLTTDLIWRWIGGSRAVGFVGRLGQRSLAVYVAHIWVVALLVAVAQKLERIGSAQIVLVGVAVALLYGWTRVMDVAEEVASGAARKKSGGQDPILRPAVWRLSGAATAAVGLLFAIHAMLPGGWRDQKKNLLLAHVSPPANLAPMVASADDESFDGEDDMIPDLPFELPDVEEQEVSFGVGAVVHGA